MNRSGKQLIFENGRCFQGIGFGTSAYSVGEVVLNTSMVGYQEIISDPSYCAQMVCMSYPLIGNYGLADEDFESRRPYLSGLIVREYNDIPSNFRYTQTLSEMMVEHGIPGIAGVDTRAITRMLREEGNMRAMMTGLDAPVEDSVARLRSMPLPRDQVRRVTSRKLWYSRTANFRYNVVAIDCGIRYSSLRSLNARGCNVTILPADATAEAVLALRPDGLFLSDGPGDPGDVPQALALIRALQGKLPIFGIGLGHQLIALANGAACFKMKFGHHGGNHPVKNLATGKVDVFAQNHAYAVDIPSLSGTPLALTHQNLLDGTAEGLASDALDVFSAQYQPEGAPGAENLYDKFTALIEKGYQARQEVRHA